MTVIYPETWVLGNTEMETARLWEYVTLRGLGECSLEEVEVAIEQWKSPLWKYHNDFPPRPSKFYEAIILARQEIERRKEAQSKKLLAAPPTDIEKMMQQRVETVKKIRKEHPDKSWCEISNLLVNYQSA